MPETDIDATLHAILTETRTIAMLGASPNPGRDSHRVMEFLLEQGYRVYPVNPTVAAGEKIHGEPVLAQLADVPERIDLVDVFRRADAVDEVVDDVLALRELPQTLWLQLGVVNEAAAERARAEGIEVVMDRCIKIEHRRLIP